MLCCVPELYYAVCLNCAIGFFLQIFVNTVCLNLDSNCFLTYPFFYFGSFCCFSDYQNHSWILYIIGYFISLDTLYHWTLYIIGHFISLLEQYVHAENISSSGPYIVSAAVLTTHQGYFYF